MPARWDYPGGGAWIRIDEDGGVRLGSSYGVHQSAAFIEQYADERAGRLELFDGGARIVWDWEDSFHDSFDVAIRPCLPFGIELSQLAPDASVLESPPAIQHLPDGGRALTLPLALDYGPFPPRASDFVAVTDLGPERPLSIADLSGTWSTWMRPDYSLDGGFLPNLTDCRNPTVMLDVGADGGLRRQWLNWSAGTGDVYATYVLRIETGRVSIEGRRVIFDVSSVTTETLIQHVDSSTDLTSVTEPASFQDEKRAWLGGPNQLYLTDYPDVPAHR
jgi:hypothetical protein